MIPEDADHHDEDHDDNEGDDDQPLGGRGILYFLQILARPTSDRPYRTASLVICSAQTWS